MNRCTQLYDIQHEHVAWRPLETYLISRSSVKGQGHMNLLVFSVCVCGYLRAVLSLGQSLMIFFDTKSWTKCTLKWIKQDCQALHKAKYYPRVAAVVYAGSNKVAPSSKWHFVNSGQMGQAVSCTQKHKKHVTLTFDLDIQYYCRSCQDTCSCKISSS